MDVTIGGTVTGGTPVTLTRTGVVSGAKVSFATPTHSRLEPRQIDMFLTPTTDAKGSDPGTARSGMKITFADRLEEEGCCSVKVGGVTIDLGIRWQLTQPVTLVDEALSYLAGMVRTSEFKDALVKGTLPST